MVFVVESFQGHPELVAKVTISGAQSYAQFFGKFSDFFSTAAAETATLAAGVEGQIKVLAMRGDSGDMVITVTNAVWGSTITFTAIGQACTLLYINAKWFCIGNNGATFA